MASENVANKKLEGVKDCGPKERQAALKTSLEED